MHANFEGGSGPGEGALQPMPKAAVSAAVAASLAGLLFGFDTAVISGVTEALRQHFALSATGLGIAVSAALWGTLVGASVAGGLGDRLGSRRVLTWIGVAYLVSAIGSALAGGMALFVAFRFLGGLAIGGSSVLAPVYISEVSAAARRGRLVAMFQFNIVAGILLAYCSNWLLALALPADIAWRAKLGIAALPALFFAVMLPGIPESPRWLASKGRGAQARVAADRLGLDAMALASTDQSDARLDWRRHRRPILLAIAIAAFNQLSGINAILYYLNDIFAAAGFTGVSADLQAVAIGLTNLVATMVAMTVIDRVGRRPLLLTGAIGTTLALAGVAAIYATGSGAQFLLPLLVLFIAAFAFSQGAVIWVYLSEIFPTPVRARGQALGSTTHWVLNAAISFAFPVVAQFTQSLPFVVFALAMAVQAVVVWRFFPETRGVDLEELAARLSH
ncbi:sugar porter (SP) family MFS transporter [Novosphingobium sp. GV055]|nr:sugar porter (SP) family MFS transporter [Novosphingobium sp. GV055]PUB05040.1 sugar porter (SP) family MFS transporter [Novosphingobium sp. GV061]PUB21359.1 sugar porter (SP) family MFS transporter [Novosphingobium sp. GV079]PUB43085.1 sugar porter (SP) family MFS transporter [Novosphingobium sp. GV027]